MLKDLAKSILIYGVASSLGKFVGLFLVPVYTRIFSPEQYGVIDLISTVVAFVSILGMVQLESSISRYYYTAKDDSERRLFISTAFWPIVLFSVFWMIIVALVADYASYLLFKTVKYKKIIIVSALTIPVSNLFSYLTVVMRYQKKPLTYSLFVIVQMLTSVGMSIWLVVYERMGIIGVFYGQLFGFVLGAAVLTFYLRFYIVFSLQMDLLKKYFRFGIPMVPAVAGSWLNAYANRFFMLGYLTLTDIGLYTVALKIASAFQLIDSAFRMAWGPFMWENFERPDHREIYKRIMKLVTIGVFFLVVVFSLFGNEVLLLLTTADYTKASSLIGMLAYSIGLGIIAQTIGLGAGITKRTEYNTVIYCISVAVNIGCLFVLVPKMGLIAVPLSLLLSTTALVALTWYNSERLYYIGFSKSFFIAAYALALIPIVIASMIDINSFVKLIIVGVVLFMFGMMLILGRTPVVSINTIFRGAF
ncbi:MAG TPA: oligosaccharide flippase family protein [Smithella sp.]|nr:oligosaccharide flippase family protein [Smithella sp.]